MLRVHNLRRTRENLGRTLTNQRETNSLSENNLSESNLNKSNISSTNKLNNTNTLNSINTLSSINNLTMTKKHIKINSQTETTKNLTNINSKAKCQNNINKSNYQNNWMQWKRQHINTTKRMLKKKSFQNKWMNSMWRRYPYRRCQSNDCKSVWSENRAVEYL